MQNLTAQEATLQSAASKLSRVIKYEARQLEFYFLVISHPGEEVGLFETLHWGGKAGGVLHQIIEARTTWRRKKRRMPQRTLFSSAFWVCFYHFGAVLLSWLMPANMLHDLMIFRLGTFSRHDRFFLSDTGRLRGRSFGQQPPSLEW